MHATARKRQKLERAGDGGTLVEALSRLRAQAAFFAAPGTGPSELQREVSTLNQRIAAFEGALAQADAGEVDRLGRGWKDELDGTGTLLWNKSTALKLAQDGQEQRAKRAVVASRAPGRSACPRRRPLTCSLQSATSATALFASVLSSHSRLRVCQASRSRATPGLTSYCRLNSASLAPLARDQDCRCFPRRKSNEQGRQTPRRSSRHRCRTRRRTRSRRCFPRRARQGPPRALLLPHPLGQRQRRRHDRLLGSRKGARPGAAGEPPAPRGPPEQHRQRELSRLHFLSPRPTNSPASPMKLALLQLSASEANRDKTAAPPLTGFSAPSLSSNATVRTKSLGPSRCVAVKSRTNGMAECDCALDLHSSQPSRLSLKPTSLRRLRPSTGRRLKRRSSRPLYALQPLWRRSSTDFARAGPRTVRLARAPPRQARHHPQWRRRRN